jgi:hypothetical protein
MVHGRGRGAYGVMVGNYQRVQIVDPACHTTAGQL